MNINGKAQNIVLTATIRPSWTKYEHTNKFITNLSTRQNEVWSEYSLK